jgi:hypothetical protein
MLQGDMFQRPENGVEILRKLDAQFSANFETALSTAAEEVGRVELKARCISSVGVILTETCCVTEAHTDIAKIYDEVFADCVCSVLLAGQGLDRPAQLVLRRVLELGVAAVYLWDLPHLYWGWKEYDKDLSFSEMTDHLSAPAYLRCVSSMNGAAEPTQIFDVTRARTEYRALSNTVHGKMATFETAIGDRFRHSDADWKAHVKRVEGIQDLLLNLVQGRFRVVREKLPEKQPQLKGGI